MILIFLRTHVCVEQIKPKTKIGKSTEYESELERHIVMDF